MLEWHKSHHCQQRFSTFSWTNVLQFVMCLWLISRALRWSVLTILSNVNTAFVEVSSAEALRSSLLLLNWPVVLGSSCKEPRRQGRVTILAGGDGVSIK